MDAILEALFLMRSVYYASSSLDDSVAMGSANPDIPAREFLIS